MKKCEFNKKNKILGLLRSTNLCFNNSKLFLHHKWYLTIMPVNFYLHTDFFPHDITLIASVVGESVIGHGIGGIEIPAKMAWLAKSLYEE